MKRLLLASLLFCLPLGAEIVQPVFNTSTPDGKLLYEATQEPDEAKRVLMFEQYLKEYPNGKEAPWVYEQVQPLYLKANRPDDAIAAASPILAADGTNVEAALQALKAAELKKDPALVAVWAAKTSETAGTFLKSAKPAEESDADWAKRVDYAKQVDTYTGYAVYAQAVQSTDPKVRLTMIKALRAFKPDSQYLGQVRDLEFLSLRQAGDNAGALAFAEKALEKDQTNEDMLLLVADSYAQRKTNNDKVLAYSAKITELLAKKQKPEGVSDADWAKRKDTMTGLAHQMAGKIYFNSNQFPQADKELRQALPLVSFNSGMKAETAFMLGVANYKMKKTADALSFSRIAAGIPGPYQSQAAQNVKAMGGR